MSIQENKMTLSEELVWRGFVNQTTYKDLSVLDIEEKITFYHGFDASADSQTVGNLASMMLDLVFLRHGHKAIVLAGGATSLIGDAGGRDKERPMQAEEIIRHNVECAKKQLRKIYGKYEFTMVNNIDWTKEFDVLTFLREVGKHYNVGEMIKTDYISTRIGEGGNGISFTEFSYSLLQGYDYLHLYDNYGCTLQLCGADQWTNCLAGVDLIRKKRGESVNVLTNPLIINKSTGKKFGKSEDGAVWLDAAKTSPYDFYQFWLNSDDESVQDYIKIFTEITKIEFNNLLEEFDKDRSQRFAQKYLAFETTKLVHGVDEAWRVKELSENVFEKGVGIDTEGLETYTITDKYVVTENISQQIFGGNKIDLLAFLVDSGVMESKGKGKELFASGAVYIDDVKQIEYIVDKKNLPEQFLLRIGKKKYYKITSEI
jgi:tyrosyl-tRNA synthetase